MVDLSRVDHRVPLKKQAFDSWVRGVVEYVGEHYIVCVLDELGLDFVDDVEPEHRRHFMGRALALMEEEEDE